MANVPNFIRLPEELRSAKDQLATPSSSKSNVKKTDAVTETSAQSSSNGDEYCLVVGDFLEQLECPICNEVYRIPINICENGHSICEKCKLLMKRCGYCQGSYLTTRNRCLENILTNCSIPCQFQGKGCPDIIKLTNYTDHINTCPYSPDIRQPKVSKKTSPPISERPPRLLPVPNTFDSLFHELTSLPHPLQPNVDFVRPPFDFVPSYAGRRMGNSNHAQPSTHPHESYLRHAAHGFPAFQPASTALGSSRTFYTPNHPSVNLLEGIRFGGVNMEFGQTSHDSLEQSHSSRRNFNDPLTTAGIFNVESQVGQPQPQPQPNQNRVSEFQNQVLFGPGWPLYHPMESSTTTTSSRTVPVQFMQNSRQPVNYTNRSRNPEPVTTTTDSPSALFRRSVAFQNTDSNNQTCLGPPYTSPMHVPSVCSINDAVITRPPSSVTYTAPLSHNFTTQPTSLDPSYSHLYW